MKILFLDQYSDIGGAQRCLLELVPAVIRAGWEAHAALAGRGALIRELQMRSVCVHGLPMQSYTLGRKSLRDGVRFLSDLRPLSGAITALVRSIRPAILYVNGPRLMPAVGMCDTGVPVIFHAHHDLNVANGRHVVRWAVRRTRAKVISASRFLARRWESGATVVYGGVEAPGPAWRRVPASGGLRVGLIGRIDPRKCQKEFVLAATELRREFPDVEFRLCGDSIFGDCATERYKMEVLSAGNGTIRYLGWQKSVYEVLAELDLLVMPSRGEGGIPFVILEALAAGVPVLASPVGDIGDVLENGRTGFLLPSTDPSCIADGIRNLLARPPLLAEVGRAGRQLWKTMFTAERFRAEIWEIMTGSGDRCASGSAALPCGLQA